MHSAPEPPLLVESRDLPPREVVYLTCAVDLATGAFSTEIGEGFDQIKRWAEQQGHSLGETLLLGVPHVAEGRLVAYDCCVQLPTPAAPPHGLSSRLIPSGRYAVLTLEKDAATVGEQIGRFFAEYVPQHSLQIDEARPSYEVYYARTMEYCVPIHPTKDEG
jgi:DNA gyrase inhibitor GyrI